jgi:putative protease
MTVHNGEGALFLKNLGFLRIVLSRELSLEEIKYISKDLDIETEIFIHGALCISYSGQCLMSSLIGGRSGNRGRCAQPCRLPYEIINKTNRKMEKGYLLSPKDICTIENVQQYIDSGTSSLKIEGRMKRPEYVAGVVSVYRKAIDEAYESLGFTDDSLQLKDKLRIESGKRKVDEKRNVNIEEEKRKLLKLFNREGFSKAYLFGNTGREMMAYKFPKNTGIEIGKVNRDMTIELKENVSIQDGIRFGDDGFTVFKIVKGSKNVEEAFAGDRVKLKPTKYKPGDILYKTSDVKLLDALSESYRNIYGRKNNLKVKFNFKVGDQFILKTKYKDKDFIVEGEVVQKALKKPWEKSKLLISLIKQETLLLTLKKSPLKILKKDLYQFPQLMLCAES